MRTDLLGDAVASLRGQMRRSPWGAFLIWLGLAIGTVSMAAGFGLAEATISGLAARLPGDMDRLYWVDASTVVLSPAPEAFSPGVWRGLTITTLRALIQDGLAAGFYFTIDGRPVSVDGKMCLVTMVVYGGEAPVLGDRKGGPGVSPSAAAASRSLIVNQAFVDAAAPTVSEGRLPPVQLGQNQSAPILGVVGPSPKLDPVPRVFAPAELAPPTSATTSFGVYLPAGRAQEEFAAQLSRVVHQFNPGVRIEVRPAAVAMASTIAEARTVAILTATGGLLVALVALANVIGAAGAWVLGKSRSLALRRALGAPPGVTFLHIGLDLGLLGLGAAVPGAWAASTLSARLGLYAGPLGLTAAGFVTVGASLAVGFFLARTQAKREPGATLGRSL